MVGNFSEEFIKKSAAIDLKVLDLTQQLHDHLGEVNQVIEQLQSMGVHVSVVRDPDDHKLRYSVRRSYSGVANHL